MYTLPRHTPSEFPCPAFALLASVPGALRLERLTAAARRFPETHIDVHVVEPGRPGGGIYSAPLPDHMILNTPCGQHSLYPFPAEDASRGMGWASMNGCGRGYHWEGLSAGQGARAGSTPSPHDFLPGG